MNIIPQTRQDSAIIITLIQLTGDQINYIGKNEVFTSFIPCELYYWYSFIQNFK